MNASKYIFILLLLVCLGSCNTSEEKTNTTQNTDQRNTLPSQKTRELSSQFKEYWFSGEAEITSYKLLQERYGEMREGTAVAIFVTEDFLPIAQVKTIRSSSKNIPVMKLNLIKKFNTGIYPYSIMTSSFNPIFDIDHALKITNSVQEWCGQVYMQLNNKKSFEIQSYSYFEDEGDQQLSISKNWIEDELWNLIRINPEELPTGTINVIPSFEFIRLKHKEMKQYEAIGSLIQKDSVSIYTLHYPKLNRELKLFFRTNFPYEIEKWEELAVLENNDTVRKSATAIKLKQMKIDYWNKNRNEYAPLRDSLCLN